MSDVASSGLMTTEEAASYLRLAPQTLAKWRCHKRGPRFVRLGSAVFYRQTELDEYITSNVTKEGEAR